MVIYASGYLSGHPHCGRFYAALFMFMASMLGLVLADNLILLFICWELTSLSSYFLIGFYHEKEESRSSALQALLVTGIGGLALLVGFLALGAITGSMECSALSAHKESIRSHVFYGPVLFLILAGAFTKSAQFPFHFWLPNAMTAPAPVSAYLHSCTMVKAGVYLIARLYSTLGGTPIWTAVVTTVGAATCVIGAALSLRETDIKRQLAYLTVSALGMMVMLLGIGSETAVQAATVFLLAHAFYKGALFMTAGAIDHAVHVRDPEALGGLRHAMPFTALAAALAALSMAALPPFFGFVGKKWVLESVMHSSSPWILTAVVVSASSVFVAIAFLTAVKPFIGKSTAAVQSARESPPSMWSGAMLLAVSGLVFGLFPDLFGRLLIAPAADAVMGHSSPLKLALWHGFNPAFFLGALGLFVGGAIYCFRKTLRRVLAVSDILSRWGPERAYRGLLDGVSWSSKTLTRFLQSGYLRHYLRTILLTTVVLMGWALVSKVDFPAARVRPSNFFEIGLVGFIVISTITLLFVRLRFAVVALMGVIAIGVMFIYVFFGAPDLAMTHFTVETLTVILLALVLYRLPALNTKLSSRGDRIVDFTIAASFGFLMFLLAFFMMSQEPRLTDVSLYFAEHSVPLGHGRNIVNVILVDFRGIDTLGEITVLAVAGIGVYSLIKLKLFSKRESSK